MSIMWQSSSSRASHCRWNEYHKKGPETDHNESLAKVANRIPISGVILKRFRIRMRTRQSLQSFFSPLDSVDSDASLKDNRDLKRFILCPTKVGDVGTKVKCCYIMHLFEDMAGFYGVAQC